MPLTRLPLIAALLVFTCVCLTCCGTLLFDDPDYFSLEEESYDQEYADTWETETYTETVPATPSISQASSECPPGETYFAEWGICYPVLDCADLDTCAEETDALVEQMDMLNEELQQGVEIGDSGFSPSHTGGFITYTVSGDEISNPYLPNVPADLRAYQQDTALHQELWDIFAFLIPAEFRGDLSAFGLFTDGADDTLAAVEQDYEDPTRWMLTVDVVDAQNTEEYIVTLIHEYGHLLTLNANQVPPNMDIFNDPENEDIYNAAYEACPTYFPGEGCSRSGSYINAFFNRFWADRYEEWLEVDSIEDEDDYYEALDDFYASYQDEFVTDYAATNPEEDIAESWTYFVLYPQPAGNTIAEQKILFFYNYPDLVRLRAEIVTRTYAYLQGQ